MESARKLLVDYLILVGIPALIVVAILKFGENMRGTPAIDGAWVMRSELPKNPGPCDSLRAAFSGRSLVISQSGRYLTAIWDDEPRRKLYGSLEHRKFRLSSLGGPAQDGCDAAKLLLDGEIVDGNGARSLEARLMLPECGGCGEFTFYANARSISRRAVPVRGYH